MMKGMVFAERYKLEDFIGQGGMSLVYRALDIRTEIWLDAPMLEFSGAGSSQKLSASIDPAGSYSVSWTSSDPTVATVSGGIVTAVGAGKATITAYTGSADILTVPDTLGGYPVTAIRYCAFRDCGSLVQITLPGSVTSIGSNAFERCAALSHIDLGNSLSFIGTHAFYGCVSLSEITLPESLERLHP